MVRCRWASWAGKSIKLTMPQPNRAATCEGDDAGRERRDEMRKGPRRPNPLGANTGRKEKLLTKIPRNPLMSFKFEERNQGNPTLINRGFWS